MAIDKSKEAAIRGLREYHEELHAELKSVLENMDHVAKSIELLGYRPEYEFERGIKDYAKIVLAKHDKE